MEIAEQLDYKPSSIGEHRPVRGQKKSGRYWFWYGFLFGIFTLQIFPIVKIFEWKNIYDERLNHISKGALLAVLVKMITIFTGVFISYALSNTTVYFAFMYSFMWAGLAGFVLFLLNSLTTQMYIETLFKRIFLGCAVFTIIIVIGIFFVLIMDSLPAFWHIGIFRFIFGREWAPNQDDVFNPYFEGSYGIFYTIIGSLAAMSGAVVIGGTLGVLTAVFLSKFCPKKLRPILIQVINLLAGIPSIVYGFFAVAVLLPRRSTMTFFGLFDFPFRIPGLGRFSNIGTGMGLLSVWIVLAIMILPITVALARASLDAVDKSYMEGALALGATKSRSVFRVVLPAAKSGVFAALILGIGRAIGETMAVVMVQGGSIRMVPGLFGSFRVMTGHIVEEQGYAGILHRGALIATGVVLLAFVFTINLIFNMVKSGTKTGESWLQVAKRRILWFFGKISRRPAKAIASVDNEVELKQEKQSIASQELLQHQNLAAISIGVSVLPDKKTKSIKEKALVIDVFDDTSENIISKKDSRISKSFVVTKHIPFILKITSVAAAAFAVFALIFIIFFILTNGVHHLSFSLLFGRVVTGLETTIASSIVATLMVIAVASVVAFPLGIFTAIYLVEYAKKGSRLVKVVRLAVETLAGMPSIVFGLFGMMFFGLMFGWGLSILGGSLTVAIMIIPVTVRATEEALLSVPDAFREGSLALGAGKVKTVWKVVIPSAIPGILAAVILGVGRMTAESAALMFTMGATMRPMPGGYFNPATTLAVALYNLVSEDGLVPAAFATASLLIIIVIVLNVSATLIVTQLQKRLAGGEKKVKRKKRLASILFKRKFDKQ